MMTKSDIDKLFAENIAQIAGMDIASGSMVKGWLKGIERNGGNYVRLSDYEKHRVKYALVEGDKNALKSVASAMGVILTDTYIEAYH